jgi:hypothetical protein
MTIRALILPVLLLLALTGAPFGMGRMMDGAHASLQATDHRQMGQIHQGEAPTHEPSTPHFVTCAACFATPVGDGLLIEALELRETALALPTTILHGKSLLPDLPPPRA